MDRTEQGDDRSDPVQQASLSKYEKERQKKALLKRKEEFESEGGVLGRKLDGSAFESTPRVIEFKDFSLNEPHLLTITLTNVSPAANYFKILPIEDEFRVGTPLTSRTISRSSTCRLASSVPASTAKSQSSSLLSSTRISIPACL
jgi:hypothetical protein